jgi:flagellar assembly protein FliH
MSDASFDPAQQGPAGTVASFVAGFASRHDAAGAALRHAFAVKEMPFTPRDMTPEPPRDPAQPRHFTPADPEADPTEGWDPFDAAQKPTGFIDPIEAARTAAFEEGLAAARAESASQVERNFALLNELAAAISSDHRIDRERLAGHLRQTVMHLVRLIVGEQGVDGDLLTRRIEIAAGMIGDDAESAILRLNPEDMPLVDGKLPANIFAAGDAAIDRGKFVLESSATIVEDGPDLWLGQLAMAIDRAALPQ